MCHNFPSLTVNIASTKHLLHIPPLCHCIVYLYRVQSTECVCLSGQYRSIYISSGWFTLVEPQRIFSTHMIRGGGRCVGFSVMSSRWFDCTEPSFARGCLLLFTNLFCHESDMVYQCTNWHLCLESGMDLEYLKQ